MWSSLDPVRGMSAEMHDRYNQYFVGMDFVQNHIGKAVYQSSSDIGPGLGPASGMLGDFVNCVLNLTQEVPA